MESTDVTYVFQDIEPGWSSIHFSQPPRMQSSRLHALMQSREFWRQEHPVRRIERIQVVKAGGIVRGLNVLWSIFEHLKNQSAIRHFTIDPELRDLYGHEYNEALMHDAMGFPIDHSISGRNVVLVSRRRVAIIIIQKDHQAWLMTFAKFLNTLDISLATQLSQQFDAWATQETQGYYCSVLPDAYQP